MRCIVALMLLLAFVAAPLQSQLYKKKVVSYVDKVLVPAYVHLSAEQTAVIKKGVAKNIEFARFSYAALPETVVTDFGVQAASLTKFSPEDVKPIVDKTIAPQLLQILDVNKELLSRQNLSEADRNTFLATKAKAAGLSASQLTAILNSGYFYIPYVETYNRTEKKGVREEKDSKGKVTKKVPHTEYAHEMRLGILWYKLNIDAKNNPSVTFIGKAQGWNSGSIERSVEKDDDKKGEPDREAFADVVDVSCKNIGMATKRMEAFSLTGGVTEISATGMRLSIGTREGVGLDDTYWIEELEETEMGQIIKTRRGFVKIRTIGDNGRDESATSYAQVITGTNYSPGLGATELPLLGINGVASVALFPTKLSPYNLSTGIPPRLALEDSAYNFGFMVNSENQSAFGGMFAIHASLAHAANVSELWFTMGLNIGVANIDGKFYIPKFNSSKQNIGTDSVDIGSSLTGNVSIGLMKKFYFRRYGFLLQGDVKYSLFRMSAKGKDDSNTNDVSYKLTNGALGFDARAGLEIYMSPSFSIGMAVEYDLYSVTNSYTALVSDKDNNDITKKTDVPGPDLNYGGLGYYVWFNYSIPSFF